MDQRIGNSFWKLRSEHGKAKIFETPEMLWQEACKYFEYCEQNPLEQEEVFANGNRFTVNKMRAFTLQGLRYFLKISEGTWWNYKSLPDYKDVIEDIEAVCFQQKFTGAAAGLLNPVIVAREIGLADQQVLKVSKVPENTDYSLLTDEEINILAQIQNKLANGKKIEHLPGSLETPQV